MNKLLSPCKDCGDRKIGCHSHCEKYITFAKQREEFRQKRFDKQEMYFGSLENLFKAKNRRIRKERKR